MSNKPQPIAQGGVSLNVIQEMGAWESAEMVRRYAHLSPETFGKQAAIVDVMLDGTILTQEVKVLSDYSGVSS